MYYNTTNQKGSELSKRIIKTHSQDIGIYQIFLSNPDNLYSPSQIHGQVFQSSPITSIRRSISTLAAPENGFLIKTDIMSESEYKHDQHCWKLNKERIWDMETPLVKTRPIKTKGLPHGIDLRILNKLLKYSDRCRIDMVFGANTLVYMPEFDKEFFGQFHDAVNNAIEFLNLITYKQ